MSEGKEVYERVWKSIIKGKRLDLRAESLLIIFCRIYDSRL